MMANAYAKRTILIFRFRLMVKIVKRFDPSSLFIKKLKGLKPNVNVLIEV